MNETQEETGFTREWEIQRKNKIRSIIISSFAFALIVVIIDSLLDVFDAQLNFHSENFDAKKEGFKFLSSLVIWGIILSATYYFKERKYQNILKRK